MRSISQAEKEKYLLELSEVEFREKVVRRLFKRLGFSDGRELCSPEDRDTDSVFFEEDRLGMRTLVCVHTKTGSINLSADAAPGLHEVQAQLRSTLERPFRCIDVKDKQHAAKIYLVASGRINLAAREWISGNAGNDARIQYLDRDDLILRIDKHCPEIWLDLAADVFPYLHALSKLVEDQAVVGPSSTSVAGLKSYFAASDRAFVDLRLIKSVSKSKLVSGRLIEDFQFKEDGVGTLLRIKGDRLLLLGDAGSGKSTLLIRAAYLMARESAAGKHDYRVPVVIRAGDIATGAGRSFREIMAASIDQIVGSKLTAFTEEDLEQGRVVLMVDGLDELAAATQREWVVAQVNSFHASFPRCSVILTTRPYSSIESIEGVRGFIRCRISNLSLKSAERMLTNYQPAAEDAGHAQELLRRIQAIHGFELNPLLVAVFALTAQHDRKDIPANITELFSKFTELMLGRWDESKGLSLQFQARVKEHVTAQFAYSLHLRKKTQFTRNEFEEFVTRLLEDMNHSATTAQIIDEIVVRSGLLRSTGSLLEFRHHLIQEYFAGKGIPGLDTVKELVTSEWWRNPIVFYFGTRPQDVLGLQDVATSVGTKAGEACLTVGLALQTCYLSRLEDKIDVWKWVVEALAVVTEKVLGEKEGQKFPILHFLTHYLIGRDAVALAGVEREETGAVRWAIGGSHFATDPELRRFWAFVALLEIGRLDLLSLELKARPLQNDHLNLAITLGSKLVEVVRSVDPEQKRLAKQIQLELESKVAVVKYQFAKEYRGQLLEYRRGAIVALDQEEFENSGSGIEAGEDYADH